MAPLLSFFFLWSRRAASTRLFIKEQLSSRSSRQVTSVWRLANRPPNNSRLLHPLRPVTGPPLQFCHDRLSWPGCCASRDLTMLRIPSLTSGGQLVRLPYRVGIAGQGSPCNATRMDGDRE
jgi:hypothetical protein